MVHRKGIQTCFFGGVVEFWRNHETYHAYWHVEGIEGIGIKYLRGRGILGMYLILCGVHHVFTSKLSDARAAAEILEEFNVEVVNKTLPLFDLTSLSSPSESFLQDIAPRRNVVYCGSALNGTGSWEETVIHRPHRSYHPHRFPCKLRGEDLNRDPRGRIR